MENNRSIKIKYLAALAEKFSKLASGIELNEAGWKPFNITTEAVKAHIKNLHDASAEIESIKKLLSEKLCEARKLKAEKKMILVQFEKRAAGIHAEEEIKLKEYGL